VDDEQARGIARLDGRLGDQFGRQVIVECGGGQPMWPRAVLIVSAHWEESVVTVSTAESPPMLYDYYGFPPHTYQLKYPARGAPDIARRAESLLQQASIATREDDRRGFDHGVFVPMLVIDREASLPVVMVSMRGDLDPAFHLAMGAALRPLRDEGLLLIGSGSSFHNMRTIFDGADEGSTAFDAWLNETVTATDADTRSTRLIHWDQAPAARASHPRPDHLIPLMVAAGAAGRDSGSRPFHDTIGGKAYSCFRFDSP